MVRPLFFGVIHMKAEAIYAVLVDVPSWQNADPNMRRGFCNNMWNKDYGEEPLKQAWFWYSLGYRDMEGF
jgi:hypothetical protein